MAITGRAAALAFAGAVAIVVLPAPGLVFLLVNAALMLGIAVDVVVAGSVRRLVLSRAGPVTTRLGEPTELTLVVTNTGARRVRAMVADAWPPSAGARPRVAQVVVPAGERRYLTQRLLPTRRGDARPVRVTVRSLGPLRLAGRQGRHVAPHRLRVTPPFTSRRHLPAALARLAEIDGETLVRGPGAGSEFDSLRDYVDGDDVRAIDWRATARRGDLVVRTYHPERDRRVLCVLDCARTSAGRVGDVPRLDHALDAALLLTAVALEAGDRVGLVAHDAASRLVLPPARGRETLATVSDGMARLEAALVEADYRSLVATVLRVAGRRSLVVLFTELAPAAVREGLLTALPTLTRRHQVVIAATRDPRLEELARGRASAEEVYAAAAAESALARRDELSHVLRRRGAEVVDVAPGRYAAEVTDRYLSLKAAGRL